MGRGYEDVKDELSHLPFEVVPSAEVVRISVGDREVTPPEVSAHILAALKSRAEAFFGEPVEKAVVTVPAYFNDAQRQATKDAGRIAGLDVLRIVNEPTAASLAYGLERLAEGVIAVYDLGGGTFDVSILRVKDGIFEVLATNGNTHLGGDDFDRALVEWLLADIVDVHGVDLSRDAEAVQELRLGAEAAKCRLSFEERTLLTIPFETFTYRREITRLDVERLVGPLVETTLGPCRMALKDAGITPAAIDEVVLVGGSTRVPLVRRRVQELFGKTPHSQLNPDEVVALGAAVQAQILAGGITDMLLLDVTPLVARHRDARGHRERADLAQHHHSDHGQGVLHDLRGRADDRGHARAPGRARAGEGQPLAGALRPGRHRSDAGRHAEDRGDLPDRRQRHPAGPGQGAPDRQGGIDRGQADLRPDRVRGGTHGGGGRTSTPRRTCTLACSSRCRPRPTR